MSGCNNTEHNFKFCVRRYVKTTLGFADKGMLTMHNNIQDAVKEYKKVAMLILQNKR